MHVDRLIDSICQTVCGKENYEELCGDLLAIRVIAQNDIPIPEPVLKDLQMCMKTVLSRFKDEFASIAGEGKVNRISIRTSSFIKIPFDSHLADDTTPPPPKKQRKLDAPPHSEHGGDPTISKPQSSSVEKPEGEDENRNVAKPATATDDTIEDVVMNEAKPSTSAAATANEVDQKNSAEPKSNESNEVKATTSSISPSNSSSSEYELHAEKNVERKLLRKIEYILMDTIQYLNELEENEHLGISSGSSQNTSGASNASSVSNHPNAPTSRPSVPSVPTAAPSTATDRPSEAVHIEEIPTTIAQPNETTTPADSNPKATSPEQ